MSTYNVYVSNSAEQARNKLVSFEGAIAGVGWNRRIAVFDDPGAGDSV